MEQKRIRTTSKYDLRSAYILSSSSPRSVLPLFIHAAAAVPAEYALLAFAATGAPAVVNASDMKVEVESSHSLVCVVSGISRARGVRVALRRFVRATQRAHVVRRRVRRGPAVGLVCVVCLKAETATALAKQLLMSQLLPTQPVDSALMSLARVQTFDAIVVADW
eukprot:CAMPEP_0184375932 /NCGR_PEP_ID=MMETSP0007-20130409/1009_1 /TAXON_ID=97485 /ORGANISM="Prymnesium parvum, Strain Texoma1" /LENGTH=164 /DNA_ID=CAMNT_0026719291 /DNA_START=956 /DNA_END=1447 /DNA_ORIENTATION=-